MKDIEFDDIGAKMRIFIIVILIIGVLCLATPVRKKMKEYWDKCFNSEDEIEAVTYEGKATQFTDCYDISNPLTHKKGKIRLLNAQIAHLEKGDEDDKK
jgi:hypothetical protein